MSNPFATKHFLNFKNYITQVGGGGKLFCGVVTHEGKVWTHGDIDDIGKYFSQKPTRKSLSWAPPGPVPSLPRPLAEMQNYLHFAEIKKSATAYVNHFKSAGQKLGEVRTINIINITHYLTPYCTWNYGVVEPVCSSLCPGYYQGPAYSGRLW